MLEDIAHMSRMLVWTGLMAERPAETISHPEGYGLAPDMVIGHIGSVLVGVMASLGSRETGMLGMFVIGWAGAALALIGQRSL